MKAVLTRSAIEAIAKIKEITNFDTVSPMVDAWVKKIGNDIIDKQLKRTVRPPIT